MFIEIKNLSKIYNKYLAVDKINFHLEKDKTIGLLGPNGCGKTTTIGMMLGLVTPSSGEILIENKNLNSFGRDEILKRFNFASPYVELPKKLTVRQNLEVYGRLYEFKGNVATPLQFFLTDSITNFVRGHLQPKSKIVYDSIYPSIQYIKNDVLVLFESLQWDGKN